MGNDFLGNCFEEKFHELWFWEERAIEKSLMSAVTKKDGDYCIRIYDRAVTLLEKLVGSGHVVHVRYCVA